LERIGEKLAHLRELDQAAVKNDISTAKDAKDAKEQP
jgi:hypothetical protein